MELVLDLHLHSRFSRAVSPKITLENLYLWGRKKGINLLSVSDFLHPVWNKEAQSDVEEVGEGIYAYKHASKVQQEHPDFFKHDFLGPYFLLSCEVSSIYKEGGAVHRIHNLIFAPNFATVAKIQKELYKHRANLSSDGRPILGLSTRNLCELLFSIDPQIAVIPCHIWTPWFALYGSRSGYDRLQDCFGEYAKYIFAVETGLSSNPAMNWRIKELQSRSIVSFSDAHSLEKMGREATVLKKKDERAVTLQDLTYANIMNAFVKGKERVFKVAYTIEFYPEEGKYHYTGHRNCNVVLSPRETHEQGTVCPVCGRELTVGVMHRVDELASLPSENATGEQNGYEVVWMHAPDKAYPPFVSLVPLLEIVAQTLKAGISTQKVVKLYDMLVSRFGNEHEVLFRVPVSSIAQVAGERIADAILRVRSGQITIKPGYDGKYGVVQIWDEENDPRKPQLGFSF